MRIALLLLAVVPLAGCVEDDPGAQSTTIGYCPQWEAGRDVRQETIDLDADTRNATRLQEANLTHLGKPLNLYRLVVDRLDLPSGDLELRAFRADGNRTQINWYDYRSAGQPFSSVPVLRFRPGDNVTGREFDTLLTAVGHSDPGQGPHIELVWTLLGEAGRTTVAYTVTPYYRVCGAPAMT